MLVRLLVQTTLFLGFLLAVFLVSAGNWAWPQAWLFMGEMAFFSFAISLWLLRVNPGLLAERMGGLGQASVTGADRVIMSTIAVLWFCWCILMGLDARYGWSHMPVALEVLGAAMVAACFVLVVFVFRENSFAAPVVKIQSERGQHVVDTGPYAIVRHPMYGGALLFLLGMPLLLGSWWGFAFAPVMIGGMMVRTLGEERTLRDALAGYTDYMTRVRWRFVPHVW